MKAIHIILRLALLAGLTACVDLSEKLVGTLTTDYYATPAGLDAAVNAGYQGLQGFVGREQYMIYGDFGTDLWTNGDQGGYKYWNTYASQLNPGDGWASYPWQTFYRNINISNAIIERAPGIAGMDTTVRNVRVGEAKFLRALNYFWLVQIYGDVYLTTLESKGVNTAATRTPSDTVYLQIIKDLKEAAAILPATQSQTGRATKGAAWHLLSKVYLTRAYKTATTFSSSFARGSGETPASDFTTARAYADSVINSGRYTLLANFADLWCVARAANPLRDGYCDNTGLNEANSEVIFAVQFSELSAQTMPGTGSVGNELHLFYLSYYDDRKGETRNINDGRAWRRLRPTAFALNLWQRWTDTTHTTVLDTRYNGTFQSVWIAVQSATPYAASACPSGFAGTVCIDTVSTHTFAAGDTAMWHPGYDVGLAFRQAHKYWLIEPCLTDPCPATSTVLRYDELRYPTDKKHYDNLRQDFNYQPGGKDEPIMRLGETYLLAAEAALGAGDQSGALVYLNAIRERARNKAAGAAHSMDLTAITIDTVLNERGREMMGECNRWYDLARTGRWSRITQYNYQATGFTIPKHTLRPIPQNQIDLTTPAGSFPQNPGY
jgi:starch-binding outer membrane protein, SusD/RagB family